MSHFSVLIVLPAGTPGEQIEDEIARRMKPWDESREVEPYRSYEDDTAEEFWFTRAVRRGAEELRTGAPSQVHYDQTFRWWTIGGSHRFGTEAEARDYEQNDREADARDAEAIGTPATWEAVVRVYNERYGYGKEIATPEQAKQLDTETLHYDAESDRAYTMITCNPDSKWDDWRVGGRWGNGYFRIKSDGPGVIQAGKSWDGPSERKDGLRADGAPKRLIDFAAMRAEAAEEAGSIYDYWHEIADALPAGKTWEHFIGLKDAGVITIDEARQQYWAQTVMRFTDDERLAPYRWANPIAYFGTSREEFTDRAVREAVPGALVTLKGEWIAPGRMGWFGMSTDSPGEKEGYQIAVNRYLDGDDSPVAPDDLIIVLDCHI